MKNRGLEDIRRWEMRVNAVYGVGSRELGVIAWAGVGQGTTARDSQ